MCARAREICGNAKTRATHMQRTRAPRARGHDKLELPSSGQLAAGLGAVGHALAVSLCARARLSDFAEASRKKARIGAHTFLCSARITLASEAQHPYSIVVVVAVVGAIGRCLRPLHMQSALPAQAKPIYGQPTWVWARACVQCARAQTCHASRRLA